MPAANTIPTSAAQLAFVEQGTRIVIRLAGDPIKLTFLGVRPAANGDVLVDVRVGPMVELTIRQPADAPVELVFEAVTPE